MDGLLVIDKPVGPTSHDVVARLRQALRERRIGHTGTLDPAASGVLPLVLGRATRLAQFLSTGDKIYEATIRLGFATDTYDGLGRPAGSPHIGPWPTRDAVDRALDEFRGTFIQHPPAFSAKMIDGRRSYKIARAARRERHGQLFLTGAGTPRLRSDDMTPSFGEARQSAEGARAAPPAPSDDDASQATARHGRGRSDLPAPVSVTTRAVDLVGVDGDRVRLRIVCTPGFYVRSLAHDLGACLGTGAHLDELRRTRSGDSTVEDSVPLAVVERDPAAAARGFVPLAAMLPALVPIVLTEIGVRHAVNGRDLGPGDSARGFVALEHRGAPEGTTPLTVRLLDLRGELVGIAYQARTPGLLHPAVILM
jgi:tRNA pseudouridine55 synthase